MHAQLRKMTGARRARIRLGLAAMLAVSGTVPATAQEAGGAPKVLPVQGNVYMIAGAGPNITVQIGPEGVVLVDTPPAARLPEVLAEVKKLSPLPVRVLLHTTLNREYAASDAALVAALPSLTAVVSENQYNRIARQAGGGVLPLPEDTVTYSIPSMDTSNGEAIVLYQTPGAHSNTESLVFFRRSDVISTGPIYTPGRYPEIDVEQGGGIEGLIAALNRTLEIVTPGNLATGGTLIIPGRGRIAEESDLAEYRNMVVIIRDRVADMIEKGRTLEQVKAARLSRDFDGEYHATQAVADRFVESIYRSLQQQRRAANR